MSEITLHHRRPGLHGPAGPDDPRGGRGQRRLHPGPLPLRRAQARRAAAGSAPCGRRPLHGRLHPAGRPRAWSSRTTAPELEDMRKALVEMLFVEGNHFCMSCEKSGNCELQALAYRFGCWRPALPLPVARRARSTPRPDAHARPQPLHPVRPLRPRRPGPRTARRSSASSSAAPRMTIERRTGSWPPSSPRRTARKAMDICPVGAILKKQVGFAVPIGQRLYDKTPIGSDIEKGPAGGSAMSKPVIATASLAGCFGCHMSLLDIDERILKLVELVEFDKSPIDDIKKFTRPVRRRPHRGRLLQQRERRGPARLPRSTARSSSRSATAPSWAACRPCATASRSRNAWRRPTSTARPSTPDDRHHPERRGAAASCSTRSIPATRWSRSTTSCRAARRRPTSSGRPWWRCSTGKPLDLPYELIKYD